MEFVISPHAAEALLDRGTTPEELEELLARPEQVIPERNGRTAYQTRFRSAGGELSLLRAIVYDQVEPAVVVTVYRTGKIAKYWRPS